MLHEISQVIRDAVIAGAAITTSVAAWRGLSAWRQQLVGKERHRVAAELLRTAIMWREAVRRVRAPMMFGHEMEPLPEETERPLPDLGDRYKKGARGYSRRWDLVRDVRASLETAAIEAEMFLGDWAQEWFGHLLSLEYDLRLAIQDSLEALVAGHRMSESDIERRRERDSILFASGPDDQFGTQIEEHIKQLVSLVDKYIN